MECALVACGTEFGHMAGLGAESSDDSFDPSNPTVCGNIRHTELCRIAPETIVSPLLSIPGQIAFCWDGRHGLARQPNCIGRFLENVGRFSVV
jgi:hypothetical protein